MQDQLLSNSLADVDLRHPVGAASEEDDGLQSRQLSQLQLVWLRFQTPQIGPYWLSDIGALDRCSYCWPVPDG